MSKLIVILVLIIHTGIYVLLPQPEDIKPLAYTNEMNSYDNFFFEKVLNIPDNTPDEQSDDIERVLQIAHVEDFYKKVSYKDLHTDYYTTNKEFETINATYTPSLALDVLSPPPKAGHSV